MKINGKNYLLCEKRGCEFFKGDTISKRSDMENYRVFIDIACADGTRVFGDLLRANVYDYTRKTPKLVYDCGLGVDLQSDMYRYHPSCDAREYDYTKAGVLSFVNKFSGNSFEDIKWVQSFEVIRPEGSNFTPASLIREWASKNHLETNCAHGETIVEMYTGAYKYLCYAIEPAGEGKEKIKITMEAAQ